LLLLISFLFGVPALKYTFYGDVDEKMPPVLYLVAILFAPFFVTLALLKGCLRGVEWMFRGRV
jgi:hypothetical protein